jgi:SP family sugar:H+ symporter-like MFS transporter
MCLGWYLTRDRPDDAAKAIRTLHGPLYPEERVKADVADVAAHIEMERKFETSSSYVDLFRGTDRRRTHLCVGIQIGQQWSGITFVFT